MATNAAATYRNNKLLTATPADLTLMLYEAAIKFCNLASMALEKKDYNTTNTNLIKAQRIITELRTSLDFKYPVAKEFDRVYEYIHHRLVEANIRKDIEALEEALQYTREMRDTWKEVMKTAKLSG